MFDGRRFFDDYNIPYITIGKNVQPGWVNLVCPFHHDKSEHLGFNYEKGYFNCWHCGWFNIVEVIKVLLPSENPYTIKKIYESNSIIRKKLKEYYTIPNKIIVPGKELLENHKYYLITRKFDPDFLQKKYDLKGTTHIGAYKFRIIAPIYYNNKIVSYQGRDITQLSSQRYKACSKDKEIIHHKHILYNLDNCKKDKIIVTEGITDVWRLGDNSCCTFGKNYKVEQLNILKKYSTIYVFFDPDKSGQSSANNLCEELNMLGCEAFNIKAETDPGDMKKDDVIHLKKLLKL